jgi:hypothetical protein
MQAIYAAIEDADTFVFVLTPDSVASVPCGREIAHAAANNKRMVPIVARDVKADMVPEALAKLEWIFYCRPGDDFEKAPDKLISALDTDLKWVDAHTDLLTEAIKWEANSKSTSLVLRGESLKAAEQWLAQAPTKKEPKPTALQTEYINASRKAATRRLQVTLGGRNSWIFGRHRTRDFCGDQVERSESPEARSGQTGGQGERSNKEDQRSCQSGICFACSVLRTKRQER